MTATVDFTRPPQPLPVPAGEKLSDLWHRVQQLYKNMVPGTTAEVDPELIAVREYAKAAAAYWETQAQIADIKIQQQMGTAEIATVNGREVLRRYQQSVKGGWRDPCERDFLRAVAR